MSNLRFIKEVTPTSGVHSLELTDVFTDDFDVYKISSSGLFSDSTTATACNLRFISAGGGVVTTNYDYAQLGMKGEATFVQNRSTSESRVYNFFSGLDDNPDSQGGTGYIFNPTNNNSYTHALYQSISHQNGNLRTYKGIGVLHTFSKVTGFQLEINESTADFDAGGVVKVYGLRVD
jgi:hypothetical protein